MFVIMLKHCLIVSLLDQEYDKILDCGPDQFESKVILKVDVFVSKGHQIMIRVKANFKR
jgi:hypothetical protein